MSARTSRLATHLAAYLARVCLLLPLIVESIAPACAQEVPQSRAVTARAARAAQLAGCFDASGKRWSVDVALLKAIARVESDFYPQALHVNTNGSIDFGVMQVNSSHLSRLRQQGITAADLLNDPCLNIDVGTSILADTLRQFGPTWRAVGAYGAGNAKSSSKEQARGRYATLVYQALMPRVARSEPRNPTTANEPSAPRMAVVAQMQVLE
jgi:soluble lytic murein transglycosylase-like protein